MTKIRTNAVFLALALAGSWGLSGCNKQQADSTVPDAQSAPPAEVPPSETPPAADPAPPAAEAPPADPSAAAAPATPPG